MAREQHTIMVMTEGSKGLLEVDFESVENDNGLLPGMTVSQARVRARRGGGLLWWVGRPQIDGLCCCHAD